jgi:Fur family ferric uptake transcriptional regulator
LANGEQKFTNSLIHQVTNSAMNRSLPDYSLLRPAGGKRSGKRDRILAIFLRQEGHLSADDLFDLVRREEPGIGRATVYRTLQWMVDADIARKVDFGEGRSRYEASYRHPRHFHLICTECHRSSEFLSSDVEALMEEISSARRFSATRAVVQIYGTCDDCRTGNRTAPIDGATTELVFARDALRMAIATERSGLEFYTRAATLTKDQRGRAVFQELAAEEGHHLGVLEQRYRELAAKDPQLESRPTFLFFKGAASGLFDAGTEELRGGGVDDARALLIGIKCERGSHKFFKRYGERFEDSEGKQVFLEFADEERAHLDLLIREYRSLRQRQGRGRTRRGAPGEKIAKSETSRRSKKLAKPAQAAPATSATTSARSARR